MAQVTLKRKGGSPRDWVTNTMHFEDDSEGVGDSGGIAQNGPVLITIPAATATGGPPGRLRHVGRGRR